MRFAGTENAGDQSQPESDTQHHVHANDGYFACIDVVHILRQEVQTQPNFPNKFNYFCHYDLFLITHVTHLCETK